MKGTSTIRLGVGWGGVGHLKRGRGFKEKGEPGIMCHEEDDLKSRAAV